jgi:hypothetical protein
VFIKLLQQLYFSSLSYNKDCITYPTYRHIRLYWVNSNPIKLFEQISIERVQKEIVACLLTSLEEIVLLSHYTNPM